MTTTGQVIVAWDDPAYGRRRYLREISLGVLWTTNRSQARVFAHENAAYSYIVGRVIPRVMQVIEYEAAS